MGSVAGLTTQIKALNPCVPYPPILKISNPYLDPIVIASIGSSVQKGFEMGLKFINSFYYIFSTCVF